MKRYCLLVSHTLICPVGSRARALHAPRIVDFARCRIRVRVWAWVRVWVKVGVRVGVRVAVGIGLGLWLGLRYGAQNLQYVEHVTLVRDSQWGRLNCAYLFFTNNSIFYNQHTILNQLFTMMSHIDLKL